MDSSLMCRFAFYTTHFPAALTLSSAYVRGTSGGGGGAVSTTGQE